MSRIVANPIDKTDWQSVADSILADATAQGASAAAVSTSVLTGLTTEARLGEVELVEHHREKGVSIGVFFGQRTGAASTTDTRPEALHEAVLAACRIAKLTQEDPYAGLPEANLMAKDYPDLDLYHPKIISPEQAIEIALSCENLARAQDPRITNSEGASFTSHQGYSVYANTHGFNGAYLNTMYSLSCSLIAGQGDDMQRDSGYAIARAMEDLGSPLDVAREAATRSVRRLGARRLTTRQVPVIFEAPVARTLISHLISAISGGNIYRKSSFLLDQVGKPILPNFVHIYEEPHLLRGLNSTPFDSEGVATRKQDFVRDGILQKYILSSYSARKLGLQSTGNAGGVNNLFVEPNSQGLPELMKQMGTGLLVTELMGQGINIMTGDYSRGASGFWIENGEIQYPVHEITIAGNLREILKHIVAIGNDIERRGNILTGSILLDNMMVAGE